MVSVDQAMKQKSRNGLVRSRAGSTWNCHRRDVRRAVTSSSTCHDAAAADVDEPILGHTGTCTTLPTTGSAAFYYHRNQQYSIIGLTNAAGTLVERYSYTAYGTLGIYDASGTVRTTSTYANRYTYTGREYDADLNLYHFRARWYDPATGGFISRDPLGFVDGMSLYRGYFGVTGMDPSGSLRVQDGFVLPRVGAPIAPQPPITPIRPAFPVPRPVLPVTPRPTLPPSIPPSPATSGVARSIGVRVLCRPILVVAVAHDGYCVGEALAPYTTVPATVWVCSHIYPDTLPGRDPQPQGEGPVNLPGPRNPNGKTCEQANMMPRCGKETFEASSAGAACRKCNGRDSQPGRSKGVDKWDEVIESTSFVYGTIIHTTCKIGRAPDDAVMSGMCCVDNGGRPKLVERYKCAPHNFEND